MDARIMIFSGRSVQDKLGPTGGAEKGYNPHPDGSLSVDQPVFQKTDEGSKISHQAAHLVAGIGVMYGKAGEQIGGKGH